MLPNLSISVQSLYITEHNSVTTGGMLPLATRKAARARWGNDWWRVDKDGYLAVLAGEGYDIRNQKTQAPPIVNPSPPKKPKFRVVHDDTSSSDDDTSAEEEAARAEAEAKAKAKAEEAAEAKAKAEAEAKAEAAAEAKAKAEAEAKAVVEAKAKAEADAEAKAAALAAAEAEANAAAEAEAEAKNSPGGSITEFELTDEPVQNTVSINEAWVEFQKAWNAQNVDAINRIVKEMTNEEADKLFPRMHDVKDAITAGQQLQGPIKVCIHRRVKMSITDGQLKHMPFCRALLGKQEHFYLHEPDALFAGANEFSALFKNSQKPQAWSVDPKKPLGYKSVQSKAAWLRWHTTGVWFYACTFVTHNPATKMPEHCDLVRVIANWTLSYRWLKAVETANAVLSAGREAPPTIQKMNGPRDQMVGVIGYDTPLDVPAWAQTLIPKRNNWSDSNFPKLLENGSIRFGRGGQLCTTAENVLALCVKELPEVFGSVATTQYRSGNASAFDDFVTSSIKVVGLAAWGNHARIIFKDIEAKVIEVYDPWKQDVRVPEYLRSVAIKHGYTTVFIRRGVDQAGGEGSCQFQATMRVLMAGVFGKEAIDQKISADLENRKLLIFPVITQLLYSKFRPKRR